MKGRREGLVRPIGPFKGSQGAGVGEARALDLGGSGQPTLSLCTHPTAQVPQAGEVAAALLPRAAGV